MLQNMLMGTGTVKNSSAEVIFHRVFASGQATTFSCDESCDCYYTFKFLPEESIAA